MQNIIHNLIRVKKSPVVINIIFIISFFYIISFIYMYVIII